MGRHGKMAPLHGPKRRPTTQPRGPRGGWPKKYMQVSDRDVGPSLVSAGQYRAQQTRESRRRPVAMFLHPSSIYAESRKVSQVAIPSPGLVANSGPSTP